jgi:hypothetical protein
VITAAEIAAALGGERSGTGWLVRCPAHDDRKPSLSLTERDGRILVCCHAGCTQTAVIAALRERGLWPAASAARTVPRTRERNNLRPRPVVPVPADAPPAPRAHRRRGIPSLVWTYCGAGGELLGYRCRFDRADGGKDILPLTYREYVDGRRCWAWLDWDPPRPLYGLDRLAARPDAPVLVCEGEKAADAAGELFPEHVAITSPGGAKAAAKADWTPTGGRAVVIWPDHD